MKEKIRLTQQTTEKLLNLFIKQKKNEECNNAIKRLFANINIDEIKKFINNIECMSDVRKEFYKDIIGQRYEIIKRVYAEIKN